MMAVAPWSPTTSPNCVNKQESRLRLAENKANTPNRLKAAFLRQVHSVGAFCCPTRVSMPNNKRS